MGDEEELKKKRREVDAVTTAVFDDLLKSAFSGAVREHEVKVKGFVCPITKKQCWDQKCGPDAVAGLEIPLFKCKAVPGTKLVVQIESPKQVEAPAHFQQDDCDHNWQKRSAFKFCTKCDKHVFD